MERAKVNTNDNLEDFFIYEMEILNYDRVLKNEERQRRFVELIHKIRDTKFEDDNDNHGSENVNANE